MKRKAPKFFHRYLTIPRQLTQAELATIPCGPLKTYLYILERTVGYGKMSDAPTVEEICSGVRGRGGAIIDVGTGLSESAVKRALKWLLSREWVSVTKTHNKPNTYTISKFLRVHQWTPKPSAEGSLADPQEGSAVTPPSSQETIKKGTPPEKVVSFPRKRG